MDIDVIAPRLFLAGCCLAGAPLLRADVTYEQQIRPLLQNSCLNCHNADKHKAGLDLSSYDAAMDGSDSGKVVQPGDAAKSLLYKVITHAEEPFMPKQGDKLPDSQIELIRQWIASNAPDKAGGMIVKKESAVTVAAVDEKPKGPPVMPRDALLEPVVRAKRPGAVPSIAGSPWAPLVALAGQKQVLLYDTDRLELAGVLPFPEGFPATVRFSRNGSLVIAGGGIGAKLGHVTIWDVATGRRLTQVGDEFDTVLAADISPDQSLVALGGPSRLVKIYSVRDGTLLHKMKKHTDWVTAISFTPDGKHIVTGDRAGGLAVWDSDGTEEQSVSADTGAITGIACQGGVVATSSEDGTVKLWDISEGKETRSWNAHSGGVRSVAFTSNGRLVTSGRDHLVKLWDSSGGQIKQFTPLPDIAMSAASAGGKIVAADWSGQVSVWTSEGKPLANLDANPPTIAERIDTANRRLGELQPARDKAVEARMAAQQKAESLRKESVDLASALAAKKKEQAAAQAKVAALETQAAAADAAIKKIASAAAAPSAVPSPVSQAAGAPPNGTAPGGQALLALQMAAAAKARAELQVARATAAKAGAEIGPLTRALAAAELTAKSGEAVLLAAQAAEGRALAEAKAAAVDLQKWRAAELRVAMAAAEGEVAARQADCDRAAQALHAAARPLDAARAKLAAAQQEIQDGPKLIKAGEDALGRAQTAAAAALAAKSEADRVIAGRQALAASAAGMTAQLRAQLTRKPGDMAIEESLAKGAAFVESLEATVKSAQLAAQIQAETVAKMAAAASASLVDLDKLKAGIAGAPSSLEGLNAAVAQAAEETKAARDDAARKADQCAQRLAQAKASLAAAAAQYRQMVSGQPLLTVASGGPGSGAK